MKDRSLQILNRLLVPAGGRYERILEPIALFENGYTMGWSLCLPESFRPALDIRRQVRNMGGQKVPVWTQGPWFSLQTGDMLYDVPEAYGKWSLAIKTVNVCLHVVDAASASAVKGGLREPGFVTFEIFTPNDERTAWVIRNEKTLTQDDFIRMLIVGPPGNWLERRGNSSGRMMPVRPTVPKPAEAALSDPVTGFSGLH